MRALYPHVLKRVDRVQSLATPWFSSIWSMYCATVEIQLSRYFYLMRNVCCSDDQLGFRWFRITLKWGRTVVTFQRNGSYPEWLVCWLWSTLVHEEAGSTLSVSHNLTRLSNDAYWMINWKRQLNDEYQLWEWCMVQVMNKSDVCDVRRGRAAAPKPTGWP